MGIDAVAASDVTQYQGSASAPRTEQVNVVKFPTEAGEESAKDQNEALKSDDGKAKKGSASNEQIKNAVNDLNKKMNNSEAIFGIHDKTNRVMIKIVDKDSKKTIKEYPAEETLDMIAKVWEAAGIMVDEKR